MDLVSGAPVTAALRMLPIRLAEDLAGIEACAPLALMRAFPKILERIGRSWPSLSCGDYIDSLLLPAQGVGPGFSAAAMVDLVFLKELRTFLYPRAVAAQEMRVEDHLVSDFRPATLLQVIERYGPDEAARTIRLALAADASVRASYPGWGELSSHAEVQAHLTTPRSRLPRLGDILVRYGVIGEAERDSALALQKESTAGRVPLGRILLEQGLIQAIDVRKALAAQSHAVLLNLDAIPLSSSAIALVPRSLAIDLGVVPVMTVGPTLVVAMDNPLSLRSSKAIDVLRGTTGHLIRPAWASVASIERKFRDYTVGVQHRAF